MYIDKISASTGVYDICAVSAQSATVAETAKSVESFANITSYDYEAVDKTHKGLKFTNGNFVGVVELGSTGNMTLEAIGVSGNTTEYPGNANIEATKQIKLKPTTKIQLDSSRRILAKNKNEVNIECNFNDYEDYKSGANTLYTGKSAADEEWAQTYLYARSLDLTCMNHGGVAVQPAGADSSDHINKIKFEHSLKVSVEHFGEYEIAPATSGVVYDYEEGSWVCLGQAILNEAVQLISSDGITYKILNKNNDTWNNAMQAIDATHFGFTFEGCPLAVGYAAESGDTEITEAGADGTVMAEAITGKYIFVKPLAIVGASFSSISSIKVLNLSAETEGDSTKYTTTTADGAIEIIPATTGTERTVTTEGNITKDGNTYPVASSAFTIENIKYVIGDGVVYPANATAKTYTIADNKFTITPSYPVHFNTQGGKGIEWGTFNPLHTSLYSADYRFKEDAPVYAVTRGALEIGGKCDYPTQPDDTKDILNEEKAATWGEIIDVAKAYQDGTIGGDPTPADEHVLMNGTNLEISLSGSNNIKIISEKNININAAAKARVCSPALDFDYELSTDDDNTTAIDGADTNLTYTFKNSVSTADTAFSASSVISVVNEFVGEVTKTDTLANDTLSKKGKLQKEYTLSVPIRDVILGVEKIKELLDKVSDLEDRIETLESYHPLSGGTI